MASDGLLSMHTEHVQESPAGFEGGFIPAAAQLKPPDGFETGAGAVALEKSYVGRDETGADFAISRAFTVLGPAPGEEEGSVKEYLGSSSERIAPTNARGSLGFSEVGRVDWTLADAAGTGAGAESVSIFSSLSAWML